MTDKENIISLLDKFGSLEKMGSFFMNNATLEFLFIRPSGNPIIAKGFEEMMSYDNLLQEKAEITKIHRLEFLSDNVAMCIFTLNSKFRYKGTVNDDLQTVTSIFKKVNNILTFIGCRDHQEIQFYLYGPSKVNSFINGLATCRKFLYKFNYLLY